MDRKLDLLQNWLQRVWIDGYLDTIDQFFTPAACARGLMAGLDIHPDEFAELVPALRALLTGIDVQIARHVGTGDWLWALITVKARARHSLAPVEFSGQLMLRFEGDLFAEAYNHFDMIAMFEHLGALPPETMALCLSGERLR
ncbi:nuclear transport factor 2 family protein [Phaeovulum sp. NW3]|uniref:nuclear transport factor 2 family protein n=1 Tax=Phaeovulum sp. NW3 TaxID=2934933 RepID=UPI0020207A50|nr:nuclear transport factor 2 family protein [Phaeovulum sp. NW3]MCL7466413.1 nuclear transport factor 2 family protein [Phaeovulum sp. NW3]